MGAQVKFQLRRWQQAIPIRAYPFQLRRIGGPTAPGPPPVFDTSAGAGLGREGRPAANIQFPPGGEITGRGFFHDGEIVPLQRGDAGLARLGLAHDDVAPQLRHECCILSVKSYFDGLS